MLDPLTFSPWAPPWGSHFISGEIIKWIVRRFAAHVHYPLRMIFNNFGGSITLNTCKTNDIIIAFSCTSDGSGSGGRASRPLSDGSYFDPQSFKSARQSAFGQGTEPLNAPNGCVWMVFDRRVGECGVYSPTSQKSINTAYSLRFIQISKSC